MEGAAFLYLANKYCGICWDVSHMQTKNLPPYAPTLIESTRAIGYSLEAAVADIIDNSIAASATEVDVFFFPVADAYIALLDNGNGMDEAEAIPAEHPLKDALRIALGKIFLTVVRVFDLFQVCGQGREQVVFSASLEDPGDVSADLLRRQQITDRCRGGFVFGSPALIQNAI